MTQTLNIVDRVAEWCDGLGVPFDRERGTVAVPDLVKLARHMGFDARTATVLEFIRKGYVPEPADMAHVSAAWAAHFLAGLEARRRWLPTPCVHDHKKSAARLQVEVLGASVALGSAAGYTVEDLLLFMAAAEDRATREACLEALRAKMDSLGFREE